MSKKQEKEYRRLLEDRKAELLAVLPKREGITIQERMADVMDEVLVANDRDLAIDTICREAALLEEVQLALAAIEDGEYGLCACCEERIPSRRLEAVPWARFCVRCQEQADQAQAGTAVTPGGALQRRAA